MFENTNKNLIDWVLLAKAVEYYSAKGYQQIEVPWYIDSDRLIPESERSFQLATGIFENNVHYLVGSAEQGFIELIRKDLLNPGRYFSISPCFRDDIYDNIHFPYFMKLELVHYIGEEISFFELSLNLLLMKDWAFNFMKGLINKSDVIETEEIQLEMHDNLSYDIMINGIEVGSYGLRTIRKNGTDLWYVYGTGIALPRFQLAKNKKWH